MEELITGEPSSTPRSPVELGEIVYGDKWQTPKHLAVLNDHLLDAANNPGRRKLVTMPPRHGKSQLFSEIFPAWFLGRNPDKNIIFASYEADFAAQFGRKVRNILAEYGELFGIKIAADSSAANRWNIEGHRGGMQTAGVGGAITGKGSSILLVDDPVKNSEEANSATFRQRNWEWWQSTAYTRLEPGGSVVMIQTRWHEADLAGRVLAESKEQWDVIDFPAIALEHDALGRKPGDALWPERYNVKRLGEIEREIGDYWWQCLYQQRPKRATGDKIRSEWFKNYTKHGDHYRIETLDGPIQVDPREIEVFTIVDCAGSSDDVRKEKSGNQASYSAISTFGYSRKRGELYWIDCNRGRWGFAELVEVVKRTFLSSGSAWLGIEDEKTGRAVLSMLRSLPTRAISHEGKDKLTRAATSPVMLEQGRVYFPLISSWRGFVVDELLGWDGHPDTPYDCGDTLSYACKYAHRGNQGPLKIPGMVGRI